MELLYMHLNIEERRMNNLAISFNGSLSVSYNFITKKFVIKQNQNHAKNFWSPNIQNLNLLLGKNASGKSTILNLLSMPTNIWFNNFQDLINNDNDYWYALYYDEDTGKFLMEGYNYKQIFDINMLNQISKQHEAYPARPDFCFFLDYDFNTLDFTKHIFANSTENKKYGYIFKYFTNSSYFSWYSSDTTQSSDWRIGFERTKIVSDSFSNLANIYRFWKDSKENLNFFGTSAECIISFPYENINEESEEIINCFKHVMNSCAFPSLFEQLKFKLYYSILMRYINFYPKPEQDTHRKLIIDKLKKFDSTSGTTSLFQELENISDSFENELNKKQDGASLKMKESVTRVLDSIKKFEQDIFVDDGIHLSNTKKLWYNKYYIKITADAKYDESYFKFFQSIDEMKNISAPIFYEIGGLLKISYTKMSDGELEYINRFSTIYYQILSAAQNGNKNIVICIDEPDTRFHPEWNRNFIKNFIELVDSINRIYNIHVHAIISSHSPFMASDFPSSNITCLAVKEDSNGEYSHQIIPTKSGFGGNIYDILKDSFFMDNTVGAFAEIKINSLIQELVALDNPNYANSSDKNSDEYYDNLLQKIQLIQDPFIRNILLSKYSSLFYHKTNRELMIAQLEKEIERLKSND